MLQYFKATHLMKVQPLNPDPARLLCFSNPTIPTQTTHQPTTSPIRPWPNAIHKQNPENHGETKPLPSFKMVQACCYPSNVMTTCTTTTTDWPSTDLGSPTKTTKDAVAILPRMQMNSCTFMLPASQYDATAQHSKKSLCYCSK